jgi:hypothetical protein
MVVLLLRQRGLSWLLVYLGRSQRHILDPRKRAEFERLHLARHHHGRPHHRTRTRPRARKPIRQRTRVSCSEARMVEAGAVESHAQTRSGPAPKATWTLDRAPPQAVGARPARPVRRSASGHAPWIRTTSSATSIVVLVIVMRCAACRWNDHDGRSARTEPG